jgi:glycosyltransferase involved in cell wall biosynthesis
MNNKPKITIIIPVYNCELFLHHTLNSIVNQTFVDWECILVDDHSTDNVFSVLKEYEKKDKRFKVFLRPLTIRKGANACRNYGFLQAKGSYIKWFDCDDLMLTNHLETAFHTLVDNSLDFVITDTLNFNHDTSEFLGKTYNFDRDKAIITAENLALMRIGWITDDFLGTRAIVENIKFNENIISLGDEYNFFIRLLHQSFKGVFINEILTHRRVHKDSITNIDGEKSNKYLTIITNLKFQTALDLVIYNDVKLIRWFLSGYMRYSFELANDNKRIPYKYEAFKLICKYYSFSKGSAFMLALILGNYFNKGYNLMKYARE